LCTVTFMQFGKCVKERLKISSQRAGFSHSCHLLMKNVTLGRNSITLRGTFSTSFFRKMIKFLMYLHQKFNILQEPIHTYSLFFSVLYFNTVLNISVYNYLKGIYIKSWQHVLLVHSAIIRP